MELKDAIVRVMARKDLGADEIAAAFGRIMDGEATPAQIGALLVALRMKGETPDELAGAARAMRARATVLTCTDADHAVDTCGTGGDASGSVNVSTLAAIVVAAPDMMASIAAAASIRVRSRRSTTARTASVMIGLVIGPK